MKNLFSIGGAVLGLAIVLTYLFFSKGEGPSSDPAASPSSERFASDRPLTASRERIQQDLKGYGLDLTEQESIFIRVALEDEFTKAKSLLKIGAVYHLEEYQKAKKEPLTEAEKAMQVSTYKWRSKEKPEWEYGNQPPGAETVGLEIWKRGLGREARGLIYSSDILTDDYLEAHWLSDFQKWEHFADTRSHWEVQEVAGGGWSYFDENGWKDILRRRLSDLESKSKMRFDHLTSEGAKNEAKQREQVDRALEAFKALPSDASTREELMKAVIEAHRIQVERDSLQHHIDVLKKSLN